jgi:hypothetical protein
MPMVWIDGYVSNYSDGSPHPIGKGLDSLPPRLFQLTRSAAWYQDRLAGASTDGPVGRSWYSSLGHLNLTWQVGPPFPVPTCVLQFNAPIHPSG